MYNFSKKVLPLKHILALPTWGQICTVSVLQPFPFDNFLSKNPVCCFNSFGHDCTYIVSNISGDTLIVTSSKEVAQDEDPPTPLRSTLIDRLRSRPAPSATSSNTGACKGLRFCVLSKNVASTDRKPTARPTTTEDPLLEQFLASAGSGGGGAGNLLSLVQNGHLEEAMKLIEEGADVNTQDQHGKVHSVTQI